MTEKDLDEFEKEFGFKLLPTSFKKPLSEITKEEYRERIEYLYNVEKKMDQEKHSYSFLNFKKYSRNYLKTFTKEELIDYIDMIYNNWSGMDISAERVRKLGIETYKQLLINREALKLFVDWAEECDFGYDQLPDEYEKYQKDLEEKDLDYCEGLRYIAIQEAKEAIETYHNKVKIMDEKLDEWEK